MADQGESLSPGSPPRLLSGAVATMVHLIEERSDLSPEDVEAIQGLVRVWSLVADLALSDLILWVPTWNEGGHIAVAQVRPTTAPTAVPEDVFGRFTPRNRAPEIEKAHAFGRAVLDRRGEALLPGGTEAYPIARQGRVIAVVTRHCSSAPRVAGQLEEVYLASADSLLTMLVEGGLPAPTGELSDVPRVGDGLIRLDEEGVVAYASPNAISALRRLGLATEVRGARLRDVAVRLARRPGPVDDTLSAVTGGRVAGSADIDDGGVVVSVTGIPLVAGGEHQGTLILLRDVTDVRRRERALLSKDATIREIHHRVKNNLQTVAAMLRLQARRSASAEAKEALAEAELRVAAIAVVHESLSAEGGQRVDFDEVADRIIGLVRDLAPGYSSPDAIPVITRSGSWGPLEADLAIPLAMALSELAHNAVEHAHAARVTVDLSGQDVLRLMVDDDGRGLPTEQGAEPGLGLGIVETLTHSSLGGSFSIGPLEPGSDRPGCRAVVEVPRRSG